MAGAAAKLDDVEILVDEHAGRRIAPEQKPVGFALKIQPASSAGARLRFSVKSADGAKIVRREVNNRPVRPSAF